MRLFPDLVGRFFLSQTLGSVVKVKTFDSRSGLAVSFQRALEKTVNFKLWLPEG